MSRPGCLVPGSFHCIGFLEDLPPQKLQWPLRQILSFY